jgi:hypothetical protein
MSQQLDIAFGGVLGGFHVGCFFHFKQALRKRLMDKLKMPFDLVKQCFQVCWIFFVSSRVIKLKERVSHRSILNWRKRKNLGMRWRNGRKFGYISVDNRFLCWKHEISTIRMASVWVWSIVLTMVLRVTIINSMLYSHKSLHSLLLFME